MDENDNAKGLERRDKRTGARITAKSPGEKFKVEGDTLPKGPTRSNIQSGGTGRNPWKREDVTLTRSTRRKGDRRKKTERENSNRDVEWTRGEVANRDPKIIILLGDKKENFRRSDGGEQRMFYFRERANKLT